LFCRRRQSISGIDLRVNQVAKLIWYEYAVGAHGPLLKTLAKKVRQRLNQLR
jgi:hypothetical protein